MEGNKTETKDPVLQGYAASNQDVSLFDFADVVVARNYSENDRVRLVSGGSSSHIQYVGKGMLTASVQGESNKPPPSKAILRTLRELSVNHVKGIFIVVQASSTNILNFGLSVERAVNDDLRVMLLGVSEDCKNPKLSKTEKRGLSGVVLVNKIAGALAENNKSLPYIYDYCSKVVENMSSDSTHIHKMLLTKQCLYCKQCAQIIDAKGKRKSILKKVSFIDILDEVISSIFNNIAANEKFILSPEVSLVLFVNNMGTLNQNQEYLFLRRCIEFLDKKEVKVARFYIGSYIQLGYFDMDFTFTVLKVFDRDLLDLLDFPCSAPGWKPSFQHAPFITLDNTIPGCLRRKCRLSPPFKGPKLWNKSANILQLCLRFACDALISCERMLNKMNEEKDGDGDTGTRLRSIAEVLNKRSCDNKLYLEYPFTFFLSLSKLLENAVGGLMGCIYCIIFEAAANKFGEYKEEDTVTHIMWLEALENACAAVKKYGNVNEGDNTLYDPLQACATAIRSNIDPKLWVSAFGLGVAKAEETAMNMKRPGYKYPDAGAHAVGIWLRAVYEGAKLRCLE